MGFRMSFSSNHKPWGLHWRSSVGFITAGTFFLLNALQVRTLEPFFARQSSDSVSNRVGQDSIRIDAEFRHYHGFVGLLSHHSCFAIPAPAFVLP